MNAPKIDISQANITFLSSRAGYINLFLLRHSDGQEDKGGAIYCRDSLLSHYNHYIKYSGLGIDGFFYICEKHGTVQKIKTFLLRFYEISNIKTCDRCEVYDTNNNKALYLKLSNFWKDSLRFSLLAALIRTSTEVTIDYLLSDEPLLFDFSHRYFTRGGRPAQALRKFVQGYYYSPDYKNSPYGGNSGYGWVTFFSSTLSAIDKMQKEPDKN